MQNRGDNMIYLDYSATTPVDKRVLDTFNRVSLDFIGNPNSLHKLGVESKKLINQSIFQIKQILNVNDSEVIFTSGSSESNNLAIKGICDKYQNISIFTLSLLKHFIGRYKKL